MQNFDLGGIRICVTGGTGFLGRHLLELLRESNCKLTCLARNPDKLPDGIRGIKGDLETGEGIKEAVSGQDIVIHAAALLFAPSWQSYLRSNVGACEKLSRYTGDQKVIYISSLAASGPCGKSPGRQESEVCSPVSAYGWSKLVCERTLAASCKNLLVFRPPIIYGSGDRGLLPLFKSVARGIAVSPGYGRKFPVSIIHARDVAKAIILGILKDAQGVYHLNDGSERDMDSICLAMGSAVGKKPAIFHVPLPIMALGAGVSSFYGNLLRKMPRQKTGFEYPRWNIDKYREAVQEGWLANAQKAMIDLKFTADIDIHKGMKEAVNGYKKEGWL